jgi:hypothetical protein
MRIEKSDSFLYRGNPFNTKQQLIIFHDLKRFLIVFIHAHGWLDICVLYFRVILSDGHVLDHGQF